MKLKKKFEVLFLLFGLIVGIYSLFLSPFITPFVIGGVILQGILGGFSGKVGPVVGGKWKGIDYMRGYVIPANPNTVNQQAVRAKFANLVALARTMLPTILQPYWDQFYSNMSGFNKWISLNYALSNADGEIDTTAVISQGTLEGSPILTAEYTTGSGALVVTFDDTPSGNGLLTDAGKLVVVNVLTNIVYYEDTAFTRTDGTVSATLPTGLDLNNIYAFIFFHRGTGSEMITSDSDGSAISAH